MEEYRDRFWMQEAFKKRHGALHKQLGINPHEHIPRPLLKSIAHAGIGTQVQGHMVTDLLKKRAMAAYNARRW